MDAEVFTGHYCPECKTAVGIMVSMGSMARCPGCRGSLQVGTGGPVSQVLTNVSCKQCGSYYGIVTALGGKAKCQCGADLA